MGEFNGLIRQRYSGKVVEMAGRGSAAFRLHMEDIFVVAIASSYAAGGGLVAYMILKTLNEDWSTGLGIVVTVLCSISVGLAHKWIWEQG